MFQHWIAVFCYPQRFLSDNCREFTNELFRNVSELLNVKVATTAAESPWSNGITVQCSAMISIMVDKTLNEEKCSIEVAFAWALSANN